MSDTPSSIISLELEIYGQRFHVRAPANEAERLKVAAKYVDETIREVLAMGTTRDTGRLAIQAALMIAVEFYKLKDDIHAEMGLTEEVKRRVNELIARLDQTLKVL